MTDANDANAAKPQPAFAEPSYNFALSSGARNARVDFDSTTGQGTIAVWQIPLPPGDAEADLKRAARHGAKKALKALLDQMKDD